MSSRNEVQDCKRTGARSELPDKAGAQQPPTRRIGVLRVWPRMYRIEGRAWQHSGMLRQLAWPMAAMWTSALLPAVD
jgi:hypothetical protein